MSYWALRGLHAVGAAATRVPAKVRDASIVALLVAAVLVVGWVGRTGPKAVTLDLGPNTGAYLTGFADFYEVDAEISTRWTSHDATAALPFSVSGGPVEISYRFARVLPQTAEVDVFLGADRIDHFSCRGGAYLVRRVRLAALPTTPLDLRFVVDSHDRRDLGLRLDWLRVGAGPEARLRARGPALWLPAVFLAMLYGLFRGSGHGSRTAALLTLPWGLAWIALLWHDPFAAAHLTRKLVPLALLWTAASVPLLRRVAGGRWMVALFVASFLIKGAGLFHPESYYPDYPNSRRFALSTARDSGSLVERGLAAQRELNVAYPRIVAGKAYAFPYSPLYYMPFAAFGQPERVEEAFRHAGLLLAALQVLAVFWLGALVGRRASPEGAPGTAVGLVAALLSVFLPPLHSRLLIAMTATIAGHLFDVLFIAGTLWALMEPEKSRRWVIAASLATASLALYVSSLFTVVGFAAFLLLLERRHWRRVLLLVVPGMALTLGWLYAPFVRAFATEIVPAVLAGARMGGSGGGSAPGPAQALTRIPLFYGWAYPLMALGGLLLARRRVLPSAQRVLGAYGLTFLALLSLRAFGGGLFRDLKEITFVGPLVAVLSALVIVEIWARTRPGRWAAAFIVIGLAAFGLNWDYTYWAAHRPPALLARDAPPPPVAR